MMATEEVDAPSLPAGWTRHMDATHHVPYYYNGETGESSWTNPSRHPSSPHPPTQPQPQPPPQKKQPNAAHHHVTASSSTVRIDDEEGDGTLCGDDYPFTMPTFEAVEDRLFDQFYRHGRGGYDDGGANHDGADDNNEEERAPAAQDYVHLARQYKVQRPYSDPTTAQQCVLCRRLDATHVLFPCEHRCLCGGCIVSESICADSQMEEGADGHCNCPLCATIIKKIMPAEGGAEVEKYWQWVYEIRPLLSDKFMRNWKHRYGTRRAWWSRHRRLCISREPISFP